MKFFRKFLKRNDELLGLIVGIITSIAVLLKTYDSAHPFIDGLDVNLLTDLINIFILVLASYLIAEFKLKASGQEIEKLSKTLNISIESVKAKITRTNTLVAQLVHSIKWFMLALIAFYALQFFIDSTLMRQYYDFESSLVNNKSILRLLQDPSTEYDLFAAKFLGLEILTNSANLFSATFLFTAFLVLFSVTLDTDNKTWQIKNRIPIAIAIAITILNIVVFIFGIGEFNLKESSTTIRLLGGLYNGIAMTLLFSRFISMEFYFQNSKKNFERSFYFYGIIIGLPMYIVVQPLYALFNAVDLEAASIFKSTVFVICFWGKLVFLFFIYNMLSKKWIHSYILLAITQNNNFDKISIDLEDVEKLHSSENSSIKAST